MIERLLSEIRAGGSTTPVLLAQKLNTSVEMVTAMLERLAQMGLIENFAPSCEEPGCQGCALESYCQKPARPAGKIWAVKGPQTP